MKHPILVFFAIEVLCSFSFADDQDPFAIMQNDSSILDRKLASSIEVLKRKTELLENLTKADSFKLYLLDLSDPQNTTESFSSHSVMEEVKIADESSITGLKMILNDVVAGGGEVPLCFIPSHALEIDADGAKYTVIFSELCSAYSVYGESFYYSDFLSQSEKLLDFFRSRISYENDPISPHVIIERRTKRILETEKRNVERVAPEKANGDIP